MALDKNQIARPTLDKNLESKISEDLLRTLKERFEKNIHRHAGLDWKSIESKLKCAPQKLWTLNYMEETSGEPDVLGYDAETNELIFCDCSAESPAGRRSFCYDPEALASRKKDKPKHSAIGFAQEMGAEILTQEQYFELQKLGNFDVKTSSWIKTPAEIRKLGGAIFGDKRYNQIFIYHNGVESYYASRGFRCILKV
jgi:hypothetical protein